jgi:hypothetical protein
LLILLTSKRQKTASLQVQKAALILMGRRMREQGTDSAFALCSEEVLLTKQMTKLIRVISLSLKMSISRIRIQLTLVNIFVK